MSTEHSRDQSPFSTQTFACDPGGCVLKRCTETQKPHLPVTCWVALYSSFEFFIFDYEAYHYTDTWPHEYGSRLACDQLEGSASVDCYNNDQRLTIDLLTYCGSSMAVALLPHRIHSADKSFSINWVNNWIIPTLGNFAFDDQIAKLFLSVSVFESVMTKNPCHSQFSIIQVHSFLM